jgi:hypothetical protein
MAYSYRVVPLFTQILTNLSSSKIYYSILFFTDRLMASNGKEQETLQLRIVASSVTYVESQFFGYGRQSCN